MDILIPTCKKWTEVEKQVEEIKNNTGSCFVISTCLPYSASVNRNEAHKRTKSKIVISVDDDVTGLYKGWEVDLIQPLLMNPQIRFCSARLMKTDGKTPNFMMTSKMQISPPLEIVPRCPTSAYAYRKEEFDSLIGYWNKDSSPFDVNFKGSGWEDTAIVFDLQQKFPDTMVVINNQCKLIHINEEKNQKKYFNENKEYFLRSGRK